MTKSWHDMMKAYQIWLQLFSHWNVMLSWQVRCIKETLAGKQFSLLFPIENILKIIQKIKILANRLYVLSKLFIRKKPYLTDFNIICVVHLDNEILWLCCINPTQFFTNELKTLLADRVEEFLLSFVSAIFVCWTYGVFL